MWQQRRGLAEARKYHRGALAPIWVAGPFPGAPGARSCQSRFVRARRSSGQIPGGGPAESQPPSRLDPSARPGVPFVLAPLRVHFGLAARPVSAPPSNVLEPRSQTQQPLYCCFQTNSKPTGRLISPPPPSPPSPPPPLPAGTDRRGSRTRHLVDMKTCPPPPSARRAHQTNCSASPPPPPPPAGFVTQPDRAAS